MGSKYQPVEDREDEKFHESFPHRSSTSTSDSTLLEDEEDSRLVRPKSQFNQKWLWMGHVLLLTLSLSMFVFSFCTRASTLDHVKQFSAYCECATISLNIRLISNSACRESCGIPTSQIQRNNGRGIAVRRLWRRS